MNRRTHDASDDLQVANSPPCSLSHSLDHPSRSSPPSLLCFTDCEWTCETQTSDWKQGAA